MAAREPVRPAPASPTETPAPPATPSGLNMGLLGDLGLNAFRDAALRATRLAEALFPGAFADVVAVNDGRVWRCKPAGAFANDASARRLALGSDKPLWIADATLEPGWRDHPAVTAENGIRFCASVPILLPDRTLVGALWVTDARPRPFDAALAGALEELAAFVASECDRLLGGETRMIRDLFDKAPGLMAVTRGRDHVIELANPALRRFVGDRDLVGHQVAVALPQMVDQGFVAILDNVFATGEPYGADGRRMLLERTPGAPLVEAYCDFVFQPIRDAEGAVTGVFFQGHDVTSARLAADQLAASQQELQSALAAIQTVFDQSLDVICIVDDQGRIANVSPRAESLWGYAPREMIGRQSIDFVHPDDRAATLAAAVAVHSGQSTTALANRYVHKDGTSISMTWSAVWSQAHAMTFCIGRDMREREATEAKLRQAQKMESLGQLTGGVAHDFNNLLTVVMGSAESLNDSLTGQPRLQPLAQLILDASENGAELIRSLLAFSRQQSLTPRVMDSNALFEALEPLLRRTIGPDIELHLRGKPELRWLADPAQLSSAMLNLCINARDAMPSGGRMSVSVDLDDAEPGLVAICVEDTGHGMTPEVIQRVMEPFFTTKPAGKGSGLGLSMVYGFALQSGGRLSIESESGRGTRMTIHLPVTSAPLVAAAAPDEPAIDLAQRRILLVEDDDRVRAQAEGQLLALGYQVTACANGVEAIERLADRPDIDLLMTDIVMPGGVNGRQLASHARQLRPDLPVLFTSGYSNDAQVRAARLAQRAVFLAKPYRRAALARALQEAFDA
jgi:PAS domain S-box-containing protein